MGTETAARVPVKARKILRKSVAQVAALMPDGSPLVAPAGVHVEGDEIVINTTEGWMKPSNLRSDPRMAIAAIDPDNPRDAVIVRGRVSEITQEEADEQIDTAVHRFLDEDEYPFRWPGEPRVKVRVELEHVSMHRVSRPDNTWNARLSDVISA
jgi:PPOX class probable F420-dependent enzyme